MLSLLLSLAVVASSLVVQLNAQDVYGCNSSWVLLTNTGIYGGAVQPSVTTEDGCKAACYRSTTCQSIDWNPYNGNGNRCYLHVTQRPTNIFPGVNHWNYNRTAPCAGTCGAWTPYANSGVYGGTVQPSVTTEEGCKTACVNYGSCVGIDWNPMNGQGHQCYLHFSRGRIYTWNGITHWEYDSNAGCKSPCGSWSSTPNTGVYGGVEQQSVTNEQDCKKTCMSNAKCTGIDWNANNGAGHQCFLQFGSGIKYTSNGVTHWDFSRNGSCDVDCFYAFTESANTGIPGGTEQPSITNVTECQRACVSNSSCVGIDWNPSNGPGHQCYLHVATGPKRYWNGVYHYDFDRTACNGSAAATTVPTFTSGPCRWDRYPNSNIYGGTQDPADTLEACQWGCQTTQGCASIDWVAGNPPGAKCYRHATQIGRNPAYWGVDNYALNCQALQALQALPSSTSVIPVMNFAISTTMVTAGGGQNCWTVTSDYNSPGGTLMSTATDVGACQDACVRSGSCKAIDWYRTQNPNNACYVFTTAVTTYSSLGVDHYQYSC